MSLKGKTAIISGASRGIGKAIALELAREGVNISFSFLKSRKEANNLVKEIKSLSVQCKAFQVDIQDFESVKSWVSKTLKTFGELDIIVNNAGIVIDKALALTEPKEWADVINTNLTGTYNLTRASIITLLKQKSGTIINITSVCGLIGCPRQVNYSSSKAGIIGFTKSLAQEVGPFNVRVNAVAPGYTETDMISAIKDDSKKAALEKIPLGRFGKPEEVAKVVRFLASEESRYITGEVIVIDGGLSMA